MSDWLQRARARADAPPLRPRAPLHLRRREVTHRIGSIEPAIARRLLAAGLPLAVEDDGFVVHGDADASLAAIAEWLRDEGLAAQWRNELLPVVDDRGATLGAIERAAVRALGLATFAVHLAGRSHDGRCSWIQLRASDKATDPGLWDTLMGGQVAAGESTRDTLARETLEEAGLALDALTDLEPADPVFVRRPVAEGYMVERIDVFRARLTSGTVPVNRDGEVERFECVDDAELRTRLAAGAFTLESTLILMADLSRRAV